MFIAKTKHLPYSFFLHIYSLTINLFLSLFNAISLAIFSGKLVNLSIAFISDFDKSFLIFTFVSNSLKIGFDNIPLSIKVSKSTL